MKKVLQAIILLITFVTIVSAQVGTSAPAFELNVLGGGKEKLADNQGKVVYIFWFGHGCPPCRALAPVTTRIVNSFSASDVTSYGIDVWNGNSSQVQDFKNKTGVGYPLLLDGASTASSYSANREQSTVIDQDGIIQYHGATNETAIKNKINSLLSTTSITFPNTAPVAFALQANYPNPFNPTTRIPFSVDKTQHIKLEVYNISGQRVRTLLDAPFAKGHFEATWDGRDSTGKQAASGVYFYRLQGETSSSIKQMLLLK